MSGIKHTAYDIEAERKRRMAIVESINNTRKECEGVQKVIASVLKDFSPGLKTTFQSDVTAANEWLKRNLDKYNKANANDNPGHLGLLYDEISRIKRDGDAVLNKLNEDLTQKAPEIEKKLKKEYSNVESRLAGYRDMLASWFGEEHVKDIEKSINEIQNFIKEKDYKKADALISELDNKLNSNLNEAKDLEEKHQKRLYVLKSLRQVTRELGFKETETKFEKSENEPMYNRSRIIYEVDTYDQGKIKFYISMESIAANSGIFEDKCMGEFDKISKSLKEKFGVKTKFKKPNTKETDKEDIETDAKPEPEGAENTDTQQNMQQGQGGS